MYELTRRKATPEDLPFLVKLRHETMSPHLAASGVDQSEEEHLRRVLVNFESADILIQGSEPAGLLKVVRDTEIWELVQVQLRPSLQGQGFGTKLLKELVSEAQAANAHLRLSVLKANPARRLYERMGFVVVAEQANAFEMQRAPNPSIEGGVQRMNEQASLIAAINEDIQLHEYDEAWPALFEQERQRLVALLPQVFKDIQHIGSTSIPGLAAKPIIDILAGVDSMGTAESIGRLLCTSGYTTSAEFNQSLEDRKWYMRYANGHRTHHLHVVVHGSPAWLDRLRFRDALRADSYLAADYERLKFKIAAQHSQVREAYTDAKSHFVQGVSRAA
jgi:GrpB-like predicted nucleotidyltransferase (UPF0157 family)/GNAT superfamily N-acetyltransferase